MGENGTPKCTRLELRSSDTSLFKFVRCIYIRANSVRNRRRFWAMKIHPSALAPFPRRSVFEVVATVVDHDEARLFINGEVNAQESIAV